MSANKTIKALREERIKHLTEIARLRALAGEQAPHRDVLRDMRLGVLPFKTPAEVAAMIEQESQSMLGTLERQYLVEPAPQPGMPYVQFMLGRAGEQLVGRINIRPDVTLSEVFDAMSRDTYSLTVGFDPNWQSPFVAASEHVHAARAEAPNGGKSKHEPAPYFDWHDAPEGATHAITGLPVLWLRLRDGETAHYWSTSFSGEVFWKDTGHESRLYLDSEKVFARPVPEEVWSLDGQNGSWDYPSLAELVREHYGHHCDSDGPMSCSGTLALGGIVYRAIVCKDDPANFLQDAGEVQEWMQERAWDSDGGEWSDNYPEVGDEAKEALEKSLEPLRAWARRYCEPKFFTVKDITAHELTEEDVQAAKATAE